MGNSIKKVFYSVIYSVFIFILLFIIFVTVVIISETNINYINILCNLWIYDIGVNMYIIYILDEYIKDRDVGSGNYIIVGEKPVKVDLYGMSIIIVNILNGLNIIILADTVYCFIFLINIVLAKYFWFKEIYLNEEYNWLYKKEVI